jgi:Domain of unknown function (DUF4157)/Bacterial SH3 domain
MAEGAAQATKPVPGAAGRAPAARQATAHAMVARRMFSEPGLAAERSAGARSVRAMSRSAGTFGSLFVSPSLSMPTQPAQPKLALAHADDVLEAQAHNTATWATRAVPLDHHITHRRSHGGSSGTVHDSVSHDIRSTMGGGHPLPAATQAFMEQRIHADFSSVRIHASRYSDRLCSRLGALAFTVGDDIYFSSGMYQPDSTDGKRVLAHELTHVAQQEGSPLVIQRLIRTPFPWLGVIIPPIGAHIRSSPDASDPANILDSLPKGQVVNVIAVQGSWLKVESGTADRWSWATSSTRSWTTPLPTRWRRASVPP